MELKAQAIPKMSKCVQCLEVSANITAIIRRCASAVLMPALDVPVRHKAQLEHAACVNAFKTLLLIDSMSKCGQILWQV